jgi:large subunit ribosomal protein L9
MAVDLILLEDVAGLGSIGDEVRVADGYARNYLLPRKLAAPETPANIKRLEAKKVRLQQEYEERIAVARTLADRIAKLSVTIPVEAADNDKLYGSVTAVQLSSALSEEGITVDRAAFQLEEPIRELGVYTVDIQLHDDVQTALKVWVVRA